MTADDRPGHAMADDTAGEVTLGGALARAGVSVARLPADLEGRGVGTIDREHGCVSLRNLAHLFGKKRRSARGPGRARLSAA